MAFALGVAVVVLGVLSFVAWLVASDDAFRLGARKTALWICTALAALALAAAFWAGRIS